MSLLGKIEAYQYTSGVAGTFAATQQFTLTETVGPVVVTITLATPALFSDALIALTALLNASGVANTYAITYDATTQRVSFRRTAGASTFTVVLTGAMSRVWGFASGALTPAATTFTGTLQPLARFDSIRIDVQPVQEGGKVDLTSYRLGRSEALAFGNHNLHRVMVFLPAVAGGNYAESYCIAGRLRIWQDANLGGAWSYDIPSGYLDGWVVAVSSLETVAVAEEWVRFRLLVAVPR